MVVLLRILTSAEAMSEGAPGLAVATSCTFCSQRQASRGVVACGSRAGRVLLTCRLPLAIASSPPVAWPYGKYALPPRASDLLEP
jgi:hypothetical protein